MDTVFIYDACIETTLIMFSFQPSKSSAIFLPSIAALMQSSTGWRRTMVVENIVLMSKTQLNFASSELRVNNNEKWITPKHNRARVVVCGTLVL